MCGDIRLCLSLCLSVVYMQYTHAHHTHTDTRARAQREIEGFRSGPFLELISTETLPFTVCLLRFFFSRSRLMPNYTPCRREGACREKHLCVHGAPYPSFLPPSPPSFPASFHNVVRVSSWLLASVKLGSWENDARLGTSGWMLRKWDFGRDGGNGWMDAENSVLYDCRIR